MTDKQNQLKCIIYTRVSTEDQAREGYSLAAQEKQCRAAAEYSQMEVFRVITDAGASGRDTNRAGLVEAKRLLREGKASVLMVSHQDRVMRNTLGWCLLVEEAKANEWDVVCLDTAVDTSTAAGICQSTMLAVFAQFTSDTISERVKQGMAQAKSEGKRISRDRASSDEACNEIVQLRAQRMSWRAIADTLNQSNTPTGGGGRWHATSVRRQYAAVIEASELVES